ncbi:MAG: hypothetical protein AAFY70_10815, partial [Bacteroidota bacterium]
MGWPLTSICLLKKVPNKVLYVNPQNPMSEDIFHVKSISQLHQMGGLEEPTHPLITKINMSTLEAPDRLAGIKVKTSLYCIGLKDKSFGMQYGRNSYDFDEGVLYFIA